MPAFSNLEVLFNQNRKKMKKSEQRVSIGIPSSATEVWRVISNLTGVEEWFGPMITGSRVEGNKRICSTDGGDFEEDILNVDHENKMFDYGIPQQHMMPVENIIGKIVVRDDAQGGAIVDWHWTFDVSEAQEQQVKEMLAHAGELGINGINTLIQGQPA